MKHTKKILIGTTNPSKIKRFESLLDGFDVSFYTLKDLGIEDEPNETGNSPEANAIIKAKHYGAYFDLVICNDSGLYFENLDFYDVRQPGLSIRSPQGEKLDDEQMIEYYSSLVHHLGGKVLAYYVDGIAIYNQGNISSFMEDQEPIKLNSFYMIDKITSKRHPGWPLDSISLNRNTLRYFVDEENEDYDKTEENVILGEYRKRLVQFLLKALEL